MTGSSRAAPSQSAPSATGKRKRSSQHQPADVTPPKRQSARVSGPEVTTPVRNLSSQNTTPSASRYVHVTPESAPHRERTTPHGMSSFEHLRSTGGNVDLKKLPSGESSQRFKMNVNRAGPRKLVVRNLRPEKAWDADKYLDQTWAQLDATLTKIFDNQLNSYSINQMYTGVENICRQGKGSTIYGRLKARCQAHLEEVVRTCIAASDQRSHVSVLRAVINAWQSWQTQMTEIRRIFLYLDRSYVLQNQKPSLHDFGLRLFHEYVFSARQIHGHCPEGTSELIEAEREGHGDEGALIKSALDMEHQLAVYTESFEATFLKRSQKFVVDWVKRASNGLCVAEYVDRVTKLIDRELAMCDEFGLDGSTKRDQLSLLEECAVRQKVDYLSNPASVAALLEANDETGLTALYNLLKRVRQTSALKAPFASWTEEVGTAICFDEEAVDQMVVRLLSLKRRLDTIWRTAFQRDGEIATALRDSFMKFINKTKKSGLTHGTDNSKTGEMIARHVDSLLKGGLKAIPSELMATESKKDEDDDADVDEDERVSEQLEQVLDLFRFLQGKAVFEAFYKRDLAKRLLLGRSASAEAEQNMLGRLKTECGAAFTQNLEQMFKDVELSREELAGYKERLVQMSSRPGGLDLDVNILSSAAWPTYPPVPVRVPSNVQTAIDDFERYYMAKHSGRKLTWKHALANCQLNAEFPRGNKQIVVSSFQAIILLLFDGTGAGDELSYEQIQSATSLPEEEVKRTLQSLACTKLRPLLKRPPSKEINAGDKFTVNTNFSHPKYRVRINQIQLRETKQENKETHERVAEDRNFECQAAVVRIMKSRKTIGHAELIAEVIKATQSRGVLAISDIKKNIDRLIEKDYMEREDGNSYRYLA